jgi:hypothetical protein
MAHGRKTGGRQPGSVNKVTQSVKEALEQAFDDMGGVAALSQWGRANPGEFYKIWSRLLPRELKAEVATEPAGKMVIFAFPDDGRDPDVSQRLLESPNGQTEL